MFSFVDQDRGDMHEIHIVSWFELFEKELKGLIPNSCPSVNKIENFYLIMKELEEEQLMIESRSKNFKQRGQLSSSFKFLENLEPGMDLANLICSKILKTSCGVISQETHRATRTMQRLCHFRD
jgi:hypothetical protein